MCYGRRMRRVGGFGFNPGSTIICTCTCQQPERENKIRRAYRRVLGGSGVQNQSDNETVQSQNLGENEGKTDTIIQNQLR